VINSSARLRSPVKIRGVFPTSLSFRPPPTIGAGGIGMGGPPPGGPPPGNPPPGNPPPGGPPPGGANGPAGGPPYIYLLGAGIPPPCGLIHLNGTCVVLSVLPILGGSG
jgi:hypothetical protein